MIALVQIVKYVISGGLAFAANLVVLYVLTESFGIWYVTSAAVAFVFAFFTSLILQKFWTFGNRDLSVIYKQTIRLLGTTLAGLGVNVAGIYFLVSAFGIWYMVAQTIMLGLIATVNFFVYKHLIFTADDHGRNTERKINISK